MSRQDNLIIWHNANNIFLICNNFEQIYQYFIQSINELSKQEKELLIEKFKSRFISTLIQTTLPMKGNN